MIHREKLSKYSFICEDESLTEQEHLKDCDINTMYAKVLKGQVVRLNNNPHRYGHDDTNTTGLSHLIAINEAEASLTETLTQNEFTEEEINLLPPQIKKQYTGKIKIKSKQTKQPEQASPPAEATAPSSSHQKS